MNHSCFLKDDLQLAMVMAERAEVLSQQGADHDSSIQGSYEERVRHELEKLNAAIGSINYYCGQVGNAEEYLKGTTAEAYESLKKCARTIGVEAIVNSKPFFKIMKRVKKVAEKVEEQKLVLAKCEVELNDKDAKLSEVEKRFDDKVGQDEEANSEALEVRKSARVQFSGRHSTVVLLYVIR